MPGGSRRADELNRAHLADEGREESTSGERAPEKRSQAGGHRARGIPPPMSRHLGTVARMRMPGQGGTGRQVPVGASF